MCVLAAVKVVSVRRRCTSHTRHVSRGAHRIFRSQEFGTLFENKHFQQKKKILLKVTMFSGNDFGANTKKPTKVLFEELGFFFIVGVNAFKKSTNIWPIFGM